MANVSSICGCVSIILTINTATSVHCFLLGMPIFIPFGWRVRRRRREQRCWIYWIVGFDAVSTMYIWRKQRQQLSGGRVCFDLLGNAVAATTTAALQCWELYTEILSAAAATHLSNDLGTSAWCFLTITATRKREIVSFRVVWWVGGMDGNLAGIGMAVWWQPSGTSHKCQSSTSFGWCDV